MNDWYCKIAGREIGPLSADAVLDKIRGGEVGPDTLVRGGGRSLWLPAREVLGDRLAQAGGVATATAGSTWFCRMLGDEFGSYTFAELQAFAAQSQLSRTDELRDGDGPWRTAGDVPGLFGAPSVSTSSLPARPTQDGFALDLDALDDAGAEAPVSRPMISAQRPTPAGRQEPAGRSKSDGQPKSDGRNRRRRPDGLLAAMAALEDAEAPNDGRRGSTDFDLDEAVLVPPKPLAPAPATPVREAVSVTPTAPAPTPVAERAPAEPPVRREEPAPVAPRPAPEPSPAASYGGGTPPAAGFTRPRTPVPPPPSKRKASPGGGSSLNLDFLKEVSGQQIGILAGCAIVLGLVWFLYTGGISFSDDGSGVYDQLVALETQYKAAKASGTDSPQYQQFAAGFKTKQTELLEELGNPKSGTPADQVRQAVRTFGYVVEAPAIAGVKKGQMEMMEQGFAYQLASAGYAVGRLSSPPPPPVVNDYD